MVLADDDVRAAAGIAEARGWLLVSDLSWEGTTQVPTDFMQGCRLTADEALDQWTGSPLTHAFVEGGCGSLAAAVSVQLRARLATPPRLIVLDPESAAYLLDKARGAPGPAVSLLAWTELERSAAAFVAVPDAAFGSGTAMLSACRIAAADPALRAALELDATSNVLLFSTEAATHSPVDAA